MGRFIIKHINNTKPQRPIAFTKKECIVNVKEEEKKEIKENKTEAVMTTSEKVAMAQEVLNGNQNVANSVKRIKKDKGLIERTEASKTILTEDNKELLKD